MPVAHHDSETVTLSNLAPADALRIEELCTRYEEALRAGDRPDVEAYCAEVPAELRSVLRDEFAASQAAYARPAFGDYDSLVEVGRGGMGVVYRAWNRRLRRFEAVKMIAGPETTRDRERFRFEAEAAAALDHPNIVPIHGVGDAPDIYPGNGSPRPFLAMKWIDGRSLAKALPDLRRDLRAVAERLAKVARAVHHAHQRGILHRDLKPANILLDQAGNPYVTDFGLARKVAGGSDLTQTGAILGTPAYMAPEQARGEKDLTTAVDVYGLGAILYHLLTGRPPYQGETAEAILHQVKEKSPPSPARLVPGVDPELEAVCLKCLQRDPADRYASAAALAEDLERWLGGLPVSARPPGVWDWVKQVWRTRPPRAEYGWRSLIWLGLAILAADVSLFTVVALGWPAIAAWAVLLGGCACRWVNFRGRLASFGEVHPKEGHSMMLGLGVLAFLTVLCFVYLPLDPWAPSAGALALYPPLLAATGMALFICGSAYWGRLLPVGLGLMALTPLLAWLPAWSPLLHAALVVPVLWWWAYCTCRYLSERSSQ
jgi:serine/threonine-protein kinase